MSDDVLVVDNLSPFTPKIIESLNGLGFHAASKVFSDVKSEDVGKFSKVVLSGRRVNSAQTNAYNSRIVRQCMEEKKFLLGICYGAEIIVLSLGGTITRMPAPSQGLFDIEIKMQTAITQGMSKIARVYQSHAFRVARLPRDFLAVASSEQTPFEIFCDSQRAIWGTQFHPEKSGHHGVDLFKNFLQLGK